MNISYKALLLALMTTSLICQEELPESGLQLSPETAQMINNLYRAFSRENMSLQSYMLSQEQIDEILGRYQDKEAFIDQIRTYVKNIISCHKYIPSIQDAGSKIASLIQRSVANEQVDEKEVAILQAQLFMYVKSIEIKILDLFIELIQEGKSMQECEDIKYVLMHSLVTM